MSGVISGATTMAPITTAVEFCINPREAIAVDRQIIIIKSTFQRAPT